MSNLGTLYCYELRKLWRKRMVWISAAIMLVLTGFIIGAPLLGTYVVDGVVVDNYYHMFQVDRAYQKALEGRPIDQTLLEEMKAGYDKIPAGADRYSITKEYQTYARPYSAVFNYVREAGGMTVSEAMAWQADEQDFYLRHKQLLEKDWQELSLTEQEKEFWRGQEEKLAQPLTFRYIEGYVCLFGALNTIGLMLMVGVTIFLSGIFTEEHTRKMDQLILSSRYGRQIIYWAKILAGISFSILYALLLIVPAFGLSFFLYGAEGFTASFQLLYPSYSYPLSVGGAILLSYGMIVFAGVITGVFVMMLSELLRSNIGTLSTVVGMILLTLFFNVPDHYRVLSQLWSYWPSVFVTVWSMFGRRTVPMFGTYLTAWQACPILYILCGALIAFVGRSVYVRYQVQGR